MIIHKSGGKYFNELLIDANEIVTNLGIKVKLTPKSKNFIHECDNETIYYHHFKLFYKYTGYCNKFIGSDSKRCANFIFVEYAYV